MKTIFFDVDTQIDFVFPAGALHAPGAENILEALAKLTGFAQGNGFQIISTADAHAENDAEFAVWKPHCVIGTTGQQKAAVTLLSRPAVLTTDPTAIDSRFDSAGQIIVEKQNVDCFTNPNLLPLLEGLAASRFVLYGVVSEVCVRCAAFGLLETGARVELVTDAIRSLNAADEREFIRQFQSRGGHETTTAAVVA